jgi:uncharacterized phage-like protein YoqJ
MGSGCSGHGPPSRGLSDPKRSSDRTEREARGEKREGLIWAATGHRPDRLGGYDDGTLERYVAHACRFLVEAMPAKVIVGMALGWDTAVALACVRRGVPFAAAVPFEGQELAWPSDAQARYRTLLRWASEVTIVSRIAPEHQDRTWWIGGVMHARNRWMVDRCQAVVALWDGAPKGGTANCIAYAKSVGRPVVNLWDRRDLPLDGCISYR